LASASSSSEPKFSASNWAVRSPDETYSKRVNQARKRVLLAGGDFIQQVLRGFFRHALQVRH